ncbi:hypothetical protein LOTGIDRAFT_98133, partial [Lottia gigantea]
EHEILSNNRKRVTVKDRDIFIVKRNDDYFALDSFCYHAGGPLFNGDIEDYGGKACIKCPWHNFKICIDTGEGLYESINPFDLSKPPEIKSKGIKQRTHKVIVQDGKIYVELSIDEKLESDHY